MNRASRFLQARGVITVFFTLLSAMFIGLAFILTESVRFQGARAQAAAIADMGNYSVFGEFEKKLLTDFEVFAVDGAYGSGDFSIGRVEDRYRSYLEKNADPDGEGLASLCFDPWKISAADVDVTEYALLSDDNGEQFYQQAVGFMRKTAIMGVTGRLIGWYQDAKKAEENRETYEKEKNSLDKEMEEVENAQKEKESELEEEETALVPADQQPPARVQIENPIPALRKLKKKDLLTIVCGDREVSDSSVSRKDLASKRKLASGTMKTKKKYGGVLDNLIFSEYLLDHFNCFTDNAEEGKLKYELEYLVSGKTSDRRNLKAAVIQVLLIRETVNYLYASGDSEMSSETGALASLLTGWIGIPAITAVMKHILLLGWAYAESLLDMRGLMDGKKVALWKDKSTWKLSLENLAKINELLDEGGTDQEDGLNYRGYLRLLLYLQWMPTQKKRALDLVELRVKEGDGLSNFQVDHCVVGMKEETRWTVPAVFSRVTGIFMGTGSPSVQTEVKSGFVYD